MIYTLRGGIKILFFSSEKLRKGGRGSRKIRNTLIRKTEIFLDFFWEGVGKKFPNILIFFYQISMDCVTPTLLAKISKNPQFL